MITVFSFARNGWVNYEARNMGVSKDGRAIAFRQLSDFVYRNKSDAVRRMPAHDGIAAIPLAEPMAKVVMNFDV